MNFKLSSAERRINFGIGAVVNHWTKGILLWTIGDLEEIREAARSNQTFEQICQIIKCWHSFWYVTDGYPVYPNYINPEDHLVCKTYMTRVEGENTRLRHYLARLHRKAARPRVADRRKGMLAKTLFVTPNLLRCSNIPFAYCYTT